MGHLNKTRDEDGKIKLASTEMHRNWAADAKTLKSPHNLSYCKTLKTSKLALHWYQNPENRNKTIAISPHHEEHRHLPKSCFFLQMLTNQIHSTLKDNTP